MSYKAVAYIRVSTREQDEEVQLKAINDYAREKNINILKYYVDKGESGSKPFIDRPQANALLKDLETLKPNIVITWSLDRLGRSMLDTLNTIINLENKGYKVITVKEEWLQTLDDNIRRLVLGILSWVAEFERKRIRERQLEAWKQGKQKGRPKKVSDETIKRYVKRYPTLSIRSIWKIMRQDGIEINYDHLRRRLKKLGYRKTVFFTT